jgi:iron complex transport system substrate-binding protein
MKKITFVAAVLAVFLTACSFFDNNSIENTLENESLISDGEYSCCVELTGGSGRATVESPATVYVAGQDMTVQLVWSSSHYDYMLVGDARYDNEAAVDENSVFTIPFKAFDEPFTVIGDTTAMSTPHEIEYELTVFAPGKTVDSKEIESETVTASDEGYSLGNLQFKEALELDYAKNFSVDYYTDAECEEYAFITITGASVNQYFLRPLGSANNKVEGLSDNVTVLSNIDKTYLVSTSVMDLLVNIDAMDQLLFSGTDAKDWDIKVAKAAIKSGDILYAGKYSAPDYELLVSDECNFAIENTMIYHNPEVKEKLEALGIPVLVETSSYESSPLGRLEWIKLYGVLFDKLDKAEEVFDSQEKRVAAVKDIEATNLTVAFFSVNSNGQITVRKNGDYISSMIDMAGGSYVPADLAESTDALSTMKISMEDFYVGAVDADVLIYNSTIEGELASIDDLIEEAPSLADFKAVKNNNVYCLREGYFQKTTSVAEFIEELHLILTDSYKSGECFYKLKE